eukprot:scaffold246556_cov32-Tisochrysis_lutea.AAC.2
MELSRSELAITQRKWYVDGRRKIRACSQRTHFWCNCSCFHTRLPVPAEDSLLSPSPLTQTRLLRVLRGRREAADEGDATRGARDWFTSHKWSCSVGGLERYARVVVIAVEQRASGSQATCHKVTAWAGWSAKKHTSEDSGYYR